MTRRLLVSSPRASSSIWTVFLRLNSSIKHCLIEEAEAEEVQNLIGQGAHCQVVVDANQVAVLY